jgi:predicted DNA-binding WGR domain protein
MSDELRSPSKHHLVLHKRDPEWRMARFYSLMIERDLFGPKGQELVEVHADEIAAGEALEAVARAKRRRGKGDL